MCKTNQQNLVQFCKSYYGPNIGQTTAAKHDAIARHYNLKRDGNHLLLTLKDPDKDFNFKDNILLDLSSETKDSYHVIFHDDLYNIPKSDKKQATRIENTKE